MSDDYRGEAEFFKWTMSVNTFDGAKSKMANITININAYSFWVAFCFHAHKWDKNMILGVWCWTRVPAASWFIFNHFHRSLSDYLLQPLYLPQRQLEARNMSMHVAGAALAAAAAAESSSNPAGEKRREEIEEACCPIQTEYWCINQTQGQQHSQYNRACTCENVFLKDRDDSTLKYYLHTLVRETITAACRIVTGKNDNNCQASRK